MLLDREVAAPHAAAEPNRSRQVAGHPLDQRPVHAVDERALAGEFHHTLGRAARSRMPAGPLRDGHGSVPTACPRGPARTSRREVGHESWRRRPSGRGRPAARTASRRSASARDVRGRPGRVMRSGAEAKRNSGRSCQCSCRRVPRISGLTAACGVERSTAPRVEQVGGADDRRAASRSRSCCVVHPADLVDRALQRPVGLHVDRLGEAAGGGLGGVLRGGVVAAAQRLVRAEDARDHRPVEPRQVRAAPDVVVGVDDQFN